MGIAEYWAQLKAAIRRSWTMNAVWILAALGVVESQFELLRPILGEKVYGVAYFAALLVVSLARVKGLSTDIRKGK